MKSLARKLIESIDEIVTFKTPVNEEWKSYTYEQIENMGIPSPGDENYMFKAGMSNHKEDDAMLVTILIKKMDDGISEIEVNLHQDVDNYVYFRDDINDINKAKALANNLVAIIKKNDMLDNPLKGMVSVLEKNGFQPEEDYFGED